MQSPLVFILPYLLRRRKTSLLPGLTPRVPKRPRRRRHYCPYSSSSSLPITDNDDGVPYIRPIISLCAIYIHKASQKQSAATRGLLFATAGEQICTVHMYIFGVARRYVSEVYCSYHLHTENIKRGLRTSEHL
jgi:hypothetical protein